MVFGYWCASPLFIVWFVLDNSDNDVLIDRFGLFNHKIT